MSAQQLVEGGVVVQRRRRVDAVGRLGDTEQDELGLAVGGDERCRRELGVVAVPDADLVEACARARGRLGKRAFTISSSGSSTVLCGPRKKSRAAIVRSPRAERTSIAASSATAAAVSSAQGAANASEPHDGAAAARLQVADEPRRLAQQRPGLDRAVVRAGAAGAPCAPTCSSPSRSSSTSRPATPFTSTSALGFAVRNFISCTRLWPPASTCVPLPCASSSTASSIVSGAWYSNGAGCGLHRDEPYRARRPEHEHAVVLPHRRAPGATGIQPAISGDAAHGGDLVRRVVWQRNSEISGSARAARRGDRRGRDRDRR